MKRVGHIAKLNRDRGVEIRSLRREDINNRDRSLIEVDGALSDPLAIGAHDALKRVVDLHLRGPRDLD